MIKVGPPVGVCGVGSLGGVGDHRALPIQQPFLIGGLWGTPGTPGVLKNSVEATKLSKSPFQCYSFMATVLSTL